MNGWDYFGKYIGIQGAMGFLLICGYIYAAVNKIQLPDQYTEFSALVLGFYFAKNGVSAIAALSQVFRGELKIKTKGK